MGKDNKQYKVAGIPAQEAANRAENTLLDERPERPNRAAGNPARNQESRGTAPARGPGNPPRHNSGDQRGQPRKFSAMSRIYPEAAGKAAANPRTPGEKRPNETLTPKAGPSRDPETTGQRRKAPRHHGLNGPLPKLGEPGGLDDPLRRGLNGTGVKWYLRYLARGTEPNEARRMVDEQNAQRRAESDPAPSKRKTADTSMTTPPERTAKRAKNEAPSYASTSATIPHVSYAGAIKSIKMAIFAENNPEDMIKPEECTWLEEAILDAILTENGETPISFTGIYFKPGVLLIDCQNEYSAKWLGRTAPTLAGWTGPKLRVAPADEAPKSATIVINFPRSAEKPDEKILEMLRLQNTGLNTKAWKVLKATSDGENRKITLQVDDESHKALEAGNRVVSYRYGKIPVHIIKNKTSGEENPSTHAAEETTSEMEAEDATQVKIAEEPPKSEEALEAEMKELSVKEDGSQPLTAADPQST